MKKLFLFGIFFGIIFQISVGQINKPLNKGHFITGGSISIDFEKTREYDQLFISSPKQYIILTPIHLRLTFIVVISL